MKIKLNKIEWIAVVSAILIIFIYSSISATIGRAESDDDDHEEFEYSQIRINEDDSEEKSQEVPVIDQPKVLKADEEIKQPANQNITENVPSVRTPVSSVIKETENKSMIPTANKNSVQNDNPQPAVNKRIPAEIIQNLTIVSEQTPAAYPDSDNDGILDKADKHPGDDDFAYLIYDKNGNGIADELEFLIK